LRSEEGKALVETLSRVHTAVDGDFEASLGRAVSGQEIKRGKKV
jgi:hypothetical protein